MSAVDDEELSRLFSDFADALLTAVQSAAQADSLDVRAESRIHFADSGGFYDRVEIVVDFQSVIAPEHVPGGGVLWTTPAVARCWEAHWNGPLARLFKAEHVTLPEPMLPEVVQVFWRFLAQPVLDALESQTWDEKFDWALCKNMAVERYVATRAVWDSDDLELNVYVPLLFLRAPANFIVSDVQFSPSFVLAQLNSADKETLWREISFKRNQFSEFPGQMKDQARVFDILYNANYCLKARITAPRADWQQGLISEALTELELILGTLRTAKSGTLAAPTILICPSVTGGSLSPTMIMSLPQEAAISLSMTPYEIAQQDINLALRFMKVLGYLPVTKQSERLKGKAAKEMKAMRFAFNRFNFASTRTHFEDMVVDLSIVLECVLLFMTGQELSYKFAMRGACLLREDYNPQDVRAALAFLYTCRSSIVHDGQTLADVPQNDWAKLPPDMAVMPAVFVEKVRGIVRTALLRVVEWVEDGNKLEHLGAMLDNQLVNGLTSPKSGH